MVKDAERLGPGQGLPPWVWAEHIARFQFAATMLTGKRVIECACGSGFGTRYLAAGGACEIRAFDVSQSDVANARREVSLETVTFEVADGRDLPCPSGWADVYVALETIEHIDDDDAFLREATRVLRPGGLFLCSTPNRQVTNAGSRLSDKPVNPFHVREYSESEFVALLQRHFRELELHGQNPCRGNRVKGLTALARMISPRIAARANSALKLPRYVRDMNAVHPVEHVDKRFTYEYLVCVCSAGRFELHPC
jgi:SAM-dependent methyltransferase